MTADTSAEAVERLAAGLNRAREQAPNGFVAFVCADVLAAAATLRALAAERDALRAALLRMVQRRADCEETGKSCRPDRPCGCVLEAQGSLAE